MKFSILTLTAGLLVSAQLHAEGQGVGGQVTGEPTVPAIQTRPAADESTPAVTETPKIHDDTGFIGRSSIRRHRNSDYYTSDISYVKKQLMGTLALNSDMLRKWGYCEINKAKYNAKTVPMGAIIVKRDGVAVASADVITYNSGNGPVEVKRDNSPWGGWKLADIKGIYMKCPSKKQ